MVTGRGESKREWHEKRFGTMDITKNQAPDLVVEVLKSAQTCGNWQGGVEEGMTRKTIWDSAFYEKSSTRSRG